MHALVSPAAVELQGIAHELVRKVIGPRAEKTDREAAWPSHSFAALREANMLGLLVPTRLGGRGMGLEALAVVTEALGLGCSSSSMCYGMHCVATAVLAAKATPEQEELFLRPIGEGRHITTLALSETGSGTHFYLPEMKLRRESDEWVLEGTKQFVTNGGCADSYVVSTLATTRGGAVGDFNCVVVPKDAPGIEWLEPWSGLGMRGNASRGMRLHHARVPLSHLLGEEGDELWYVFEVVAPYFIVAMSGTYLGVAQAALNLVVQHLKDRHYTATGESLAQQTSAQEALARMWAQVSSARLLLYQAARLGDAGSPEALAYLMSSKAEIADVAVAVTNDAMTLCGGIAYRENSTLARLLRDARASHVMAPTTSLLRQWTGRVLLGKNIL
jgi:isovaleryl-CoA dehydrogenase